MFKPFSMIPISSLSLPSFAARMPLHMSIGTIQQSYKCPQSKGNARAWSKMGGGGEGSGNLESKG